MSPSKRRVVVLGATGSIGASAQKVARDIPQHMELVGLAAQQNAEGLARATAEFGVRHISLTDSSRAEELRALAPAGTEIHLGEEGLIRLATLPEADLVLVAIVGTAGLRPALAALEAGKDLAVASKEILVMAGEAVTRTAQRTGRRILPVDSEHNAIFQCLEGRNAQDISRLILTASGGPFRTWSSELISRATVQEALRHPTWDMGRKITIDSATLFNKGLEMIEAHWLFGVPMEKIDVVVHPQSIVHSMVEFADNSVLAQLSHSDMCFPIQYAVTWPQRVRTSLRPLDFAALARLDFEAPREDVFPALRLAREAGSRGGTLPSVLNAANEVAVEAFLHGRISFPRIWELVAEVMAAHTTVDHPTLEQIVQADNEARSQAQERIAPQNIG
jgi:1-deoxy-D-xylulose-5-phosphate reductoisomerase